MSTIPFFTTIPTNIIAPIKAIILNGIGEGSETWQPMGVTVAFGLSISTGVTLILIPTIYASLLGRRVRRARRAFQRRRV